MYPLINVRVKRYVQGSVPSNRDSCASKWWLCTYTYLEHFIGSCMWS